MQNCMKKITFIMAALTLVLFTFMVPAQKIKAEESKLLYTFNKSTTMGWSVLNTADKGGAFNTSTKAPIEYSEDLRQEGNKGTLKINANYTGKSWDDTSIIADLGTGEDFSKYDTLDYDLYVPANFNGQLNLGSAAQTKNWTWIDDVFKDDYSGIDLKNGTKVTINGNDYIKLHITRSKAKLDQQKDKNFVRFIIKIVASNTKWTGAIYIDNIAVSKGGYIYQPSTTSGKADIKLEAEKGKLTGLNKKSDKAASGKSYVDGFDDSSDSLKVTANIKVSGTYTIIIGYKTIGGSKINPLFLNKEKIKDFTFADTADFKEAIVGSYDMEAGKNTFEIGMSWGWIAVDYIRFVGGDGKQVSKVNLSLSTTDSAAYDIPVTLTALADDSAEYKFMVRKSGEEWKDINSYSTSNSCIWVPGQPGDYEVKVYARGSETKVDKQAEATVTYKALESYVNKPLVSQMFGNDMVLQRNEENTIYGWDKPGSTITIKLGMKKNFQTYTGVADANGEWKVEIGNHRAGGPYTITVKGSSDKVKLENVLFGDVYLCSGQSNMAFMLAAAENGDKEIEKSNYPNIRYIKIPETTSAVPVKTMNSTAVWQVCSADTSRQLSAVAYFYARKLNKDLKVPIGIVFSAVGGTKAESWTSYDSLKNLPDYADEATKITTGAKDIQIASSPVALYNAMIAPVAPFKLKGVLWYQGESNWGEKAYNVLLPTLIADWRKHFNDSDLPFIIIQITAYGQVQTDASPVQSGTGLPEIREAQLKTMLNDKNVGLVTICDLGDPENIHPTDKQDVGARAAICAEGIIYGKNIVYSGPIYDSMAIDGNKITISFTSTGSGLIVGSKDGLKSVKVVKNGKLTGFAIAGADGVFYSADAVISGDKVIVSSSKVTNPVAVRYGWYDSPVINLYNKDGLIASPFRTDVN